MLTPRGKLALALGALTYVGAWAFGSRPLYPVAVGLLAAATAAWLSVRVAARPFAFARHAHSGEHVEGDDVAVDLELRPHGPIGFASVDVVERVAGLGERVTALRRDGRLLRGRYVLAGVPRGRYALDEAVAVVEDPFGLAQARVPLDAHGALLVLPRLVEVPSVFSESGLNAHDGRRLLLRRPTGFDLHSVREYVEGESLRAVHWRSTARKGELMVKELEDEPRDEVAILLDGDRRAVAGRRGDSSFDAQVRAAGSLLRAQVSRDRRAALVVNSLAREVQRVRSYAADWRRALELLAAAEPNAETSAAALLADGTNVLGRAREVAVVTARLEPPLVDRLVDRAGSDGRVSLVYVVAATYAGARPPHEPALLRLQAAGVPVAVVRRGDDLAQVLAAPRAAEAVGA